MTAATFARMITALCILAAVGAVALTLGGAYELGRVQSVAEACDG